MGKSFEIPKRLIMEAWERVQANGGAPGVDAVSTAAFGSAERNNLYKLWNRMSAGSYLPAPVRAVEIPKDHGAGIRTLGVPTVADRVAQTAVARLLEERLEPIFHPDSYGYRPGRSALDAPWAKDAVGGTVATSYTINASAVTQHVAFTDDTAFPVVADPSGWCRAPS